MKQYIIENLIGLLAFSVTYVMALYYFMYREDKKSIKESKKRALDKIDRAIRRSEDINKFRDMIFTKKELIEALANIPDDDFIMIQVGRNSHPIIEVDDSTAIGFWEIKCDSERCFWDELERSKDHV